jgi:hypothetical protein
VLDDNTGVYLYHNFSEPGKYQNLNVATDETGQTIGRRGVKEGLKYTAPKHKDDSNVLKYALYAQNDRFINPTPISQQEKNKETLEYIEAEKPKVTDYRIIQNMQREMKEIDERIKSAYK